MANENAGLYTRGIDTLAPANLTGVETAPFDTQLAGGANPQTGAITTGMLGIGLETVAAFGASQGNATAIVGNAGQIIVTVTASTEGVKLPTAVTGLRYTILADPAVGVKVYPFLGDIIGAASANAAMALAKNTVATFVAVDSSHWRVLRGA